MSKKVLIIIILMASLLISIILAPTLADDFNDNKCYDEWDWCNGGTEDQNAYWWNAGWCAAAIDTGFIGGTIEACTASPDDYYHAPELQHKEKSKSTDNDACSTTSEDDSCEPHLSYTFIGSCELDFGSIYQIFDIYEVDDGSSTWTELIDVEMLPYDPGYDLCIF